MSTEDPARLSALTLVLRRRWRLLAALALLGALLGAGASLLFSPGYQTSTSVLLQGPREPDELLTEAQIAASTVVLDRTALTLGWNVTGTELHESVTAAITDGNVIGISATADTPDRAKQLADQVAQEYVRFATQLASSTADATAQAQQEQREVLRQQIEQTNERITALHASLGQGQTVESVQARTDLEALRSALRDAMAKLEEVDLASAQTKLVVMGQAELPSGPAAPSLPHFIVGGAAVFFLAGLFGHLFAARADRRLRDEAQIGAALGAPLLGSIDVLDRGPDQQGARPPPPWHVQLRQFVLHDRHWNDPQLPVADDEGSREIRCRRVLSRLPGDSMRPRRVLVVVADDDKIGFRAAEMLASIAETQRLAALDVVAVSAIRPTVPEDAAAAGVLVVVTAGTRTAWELVTIAGACVDAGHQKIAAVVTYRARTTGSRPRGGPGGEPTAAVPAGSAMAGSP